MVCDETRNVNIAGLLVLSTMFVSVSGSLPVTSDIKMIEVWLLFSLLVHFSEVLLQVCVLLTIENTLNSLKVYTDTLREDPKEINHHGKPRDVEEETKDDSKMAPIENVIKVSPADLKHRREDKEVEARRQYYKEIAKIKKNKEKLLRCKRIGRVYIPIFITLFVTSYWVYGLSNM